MNRNNWYLWIGVFLMLGVIARYAYLASQPPSECNHFFGRDAACAAIEDFPGGEPELRRRLGLPAKR